MTLPKQRNEVSGFCNFGLFTNELQIKLANHPNTTHDKYLIWVLKGPSEHHV